MKKILIFRSSNLLVLERLLNDIRKKFSSNCEIYLAVQEEFYAKMKQKYDYINYIIFDNGFFNYINYKNSINKYSKLICQKYDYIYIPISTTKINGNEEIEKIVCTLHKKKVYIFSSDFKYHRRISNLVFIKYEKILKYKCKIFRNCLCIILYKIFIKICSIYLRIGARKNVK